MRLMDAAEACRFYPHVFDQNIVDKELYLLYLVWQHSDVQSASLWMSHAATTDHAHSSASSPSTSSPPKTLVVPPVIPENREVSSVSGRQHQRRSSSSSSPVSVCVRSRPTSVGVPVPANETSARRTGWSERTRSGTDRRRSVPAVIIADRQTVVDQLRITNMLSNFPKVNTLHVRVSLAYDIALHICRLKAAAASTSDPWLPCQKLFHENLLLSLCVRCWRAICLQ